MKTKPDFRKETKSRSDSVGMQNLVQQNSFTKYKFITKTWKDNPRKGKKDKRRPAGRRCARRGGKRGQRCQEEGRVEHKEGAEANPPKRHGSLSVGLTVKQCMLKQCSASRPFDF